MQRSGVSWMRNRWTRHNSLKKTRNLEPAASKDIHKELKSFMESIHHLNKFIPNLAQLCTSLRPLLTTTNKFNFEWNEDSEKAFKNILDTVKNITENRHFVSNKEKSILCDASHNWIGAALQQRHWGVGQPLRVNRIS